MISSAVLGVPFFGFGTSSQWSGYHCRRRSERDTTVHCYCTKCCNSVLHPSSAGRSVLHCVPKKLDHQTHGGNFVKS